MSVSEYNKPDMSLAEHNVFEPDFEPEYLPYDEANYDGYSAAPLIIAGATEARQKNLEWNFYNGVYTEVLNVAKPGVASFAARAVLNRMYQREGMNSISYAHRGNRTPRPWLVEGVSRREVLDACDLAKYGGASPVQNDIARQALGMCSIELANLTMFNRQRSQLEPEMWDAVAELTGSDATPKSSDVHALKILGFDRPLDSQHIGAMRIGMKRSIGTLEDGTEIKARTTAIINTSPSSGFDQGLLERFRDLKDQPNRYEVMAELPEVRRAVAWLIDTKLADGIVLARNETVYEHTPEAVKL